MKLLAKILRRERYAGRSSLWRGAWIETMAEGKDGDEDKSLLSMERGVD